MKTQEALEIFIAKATTVMFQGLPWGVHLLEMKENSQLNNQEGLEIFIAEATTVMFQGLPWGIHLSEMKKNLLLKKEWLLKACSNTGILHDIDPIIWK